MAHPILGLSNIQSTEWIFKGSNASVTACEIPQSCAAFGWKNRNGV